MECPGCREVMEKGYIMSPCPAINWSKEKKDWTLWGSENLVRGKYGLANANIEAYRCKNCRIIILNYKEKSKESNA
jgi:hypothetical protein